jgi:hypothetical protein
MMLQRNYLSVSHMRSRRKMVRIDESPRAMSAEILAGGRRA